MRILIKSTLLSVILLKGVLYAATPGAYLGFHQGYGALWGTKGQDPVTKKDSNYQVSGKDFGLLSSKHPLYSMTLHYQHSEKWGVTAAFTKFSALERAQTICESKMFSMMVKRELFNHGNFNVYWPLGAWDVMTNEITQATQRAYPRDGSGVLTGIGAQLNLSRLWIDVGYSYLVSLYGVQPTNQFTVSVGFKLIDAFNQKEAIEPLPAVHEVSAD